MFCEAAWALLKPRISTRWWWVCFKIAYCTAFFAFVIHPFCKETKSNFCRLIVPPPGEKIVQVGLVMQREDYILPTPQQICWTTKQHTFQSKSMELARGFAKSSHLFWFVCVEKRMIRKTPARLVIVGLCCPKIPLTALIFLRWVSAVLEERRFNSPSLRTRVSSNFKWLRFSQKWLWRFSCCPF